MTNGDGHIDSLTYTPVKGTALVRPPWVEAGPGGIAQDRLFHVLDARSGRQLGAAPRLLPVRTTYDPESNRLAVQVPGADPVSAEVVLGDPVTARVAWDKNRPLESREVLGPWSRVFSEHLERDVILARALPATRAVDVAPLTLVSHASVRRAEEQLGGQPLGTGRFRMNLNVDGLRAHEEDEWYGRRVAVGDAVLRITGPVPRCAVTTYNPVSGERDANTLKAIVQYRAPIPAPDTGQPVKAPFGVYAVVEQAGRIAVGDRLQLVP